MIKLLGSLLLLAPLGALVPSRGEVAGEVAESQGPGEDTHRLLATYCLSCHRGDEPKGAVRFDTLASLPPHERAPLLAKVRDAVLFEEMPPAEESQPTDAERGELLAWIGAQLADGEEADLRDKLRYPEYGNLVDHERLFGEESGAVGWTPARRWLVSPQIFLERVIEVFGLEERERRNFVVRGFYGVTNPFLLPERSGVRYYDIGQLDGGHLLVMLGNAKWIASKQIHAARLQRPDADRLPELPRDDRWFPRTTPAAFAAIVLADGPPSDAQRTAAVHEQFARVLRRTPTPAEEAAYLDLLDEAIALAGNVEGLRQMLIAVLLESEFLYRSELGGGEEDEHGRRMLTPSEGAEAISYALGDRGPDAALRAAAVEGRLASRADYEREVRRLLADTSYYAGPVDPTLDGKHYRSNETSHPKVIRFFREFFGYPGALKIFKDGKRALGLYRNPDRGSQGTPGWLVYEADRIVTWHVEKDRDVFGALLTSDEFFVYHDMENAKGLQVLEEWRTVHERLKDTPWKTEPEKVLQEHLEFLVSVPSMRIQDASKPGELVNYLHFFQESFGAGRTPFTRVPWSHGYTYHHAPFYGLPPTPSIERYGSWKSTKYMGDGLAEQEFWDYEPVQPFRIAERKGILTHPAWLIAHSTNFHSDLIRRGRWIREKLLAGRVPDTPITVDARVPEDPHKTYRQRVEEVTSSAECLRCHEHMNPLGRAFEMYDDFGRPRSEEPLEHPDNLIRAGNGKTSFDVYPTAPVLTNGTLSGTGDPALDGEVADALELIDRLARSERVRQSILRHAFRFYLGRNERLSDSRTLVDAERAYLESGGSFREVIVSLLCSDSFLYRRDEGTR